MLILDDLNTCLYEAFDLGESRRIADELEIRHKPKYGSWLNRAEVEMSVLVPQCGGRMDGQCKAFRKRSDCVGRRTQR